MTLTPEELIAEIRQDAGVLHALNEVGADPEKDHDVEHHFLSEEVETLQALTKVLKILGHEASEPEELEGLYSIDVVHRQPLGIHEILREAMLMRLLAGSLDARYDGWAAAAEI